MQHKQQIKKTVSSILLFMLFYTCPNAQYNLVPNSSFEDYITCPKKLNNYLPSPWLYACKKNLAYYNSCCTDVFASVPFNVIADFCYQYAHIGDAYALADFLYSGERTYIQVKLKDSLHFGKKYYGEYFVNIPNSLKLACNNIEMLFTNAVIYSDPNRLTFNPIIANAQVVNYGNPIINDTLNWIKVSGIFTAQGGEQYLTLGNFKTDAATSYKVILPSSPYAKASYYIDDVSVIPLDSMCLKADAGRDTTIAVGDSVFIGSYTNGIDTLMWLENGTIKKDSTRPGFWIKPTTISTSFYVLQQTVNGCYSSDTIYINAVLPLNFISYSVISNAVRNLEKSVQNIWTTTNEINVSHYNIQRSTNNKDFTTIGTVKAKNKSSNQYTFYDAPPVEGLGVVYYRISAVDNDGKKTYSQIKKLSTVNYQL